MPIAEKLIHPVGVEFGVAGMARAILEGVMTPYMQTKDPTIVSGNLNLLPSKGAIAPLRMFDAVMSVRGFSEWLEVNFQDGQLDQAHQFCFDRLDPSERRQCLWVLFGPRRKKGLLVFEFDRNCGIEGIRLYFNAK